MYYLKLIIRLTLISSLVLLPSLSAAQNCPEFSEVFKDGQWQTPKNWNNFPLSPLVSTTGEAMITAQGLIRVYYLEKKQTLRCIYSKAGTGVKDNTFIVEQELKSFAPDDKEPWQLILGNVWSCSQPSQTQDRVVIKSSDCSWK